MTIYSKKEIVDVIKNAAEKYGIPQEDFLKFAAIETGYTFNPNAKNPSGAKGLFQFMPDTAKQYGISGKEFEVVANTDAAARLYIANQKSVEKSYASNGYLYLSGNKKPNGLDMYILHQQGAGGYASIQKGIELGTFSRPDTRRNMLNNLGGDFNEITGINRTNFSKMSDKEMGITFASYWKEKYENIQTKDLEHIKGASKTSAAQIAKELELAKLQVSLATDINIAKGQKKTILELGEHLKSHSFDNLKDVQKLDALAKTAGIELVTPAEAILADKEKINLTNKADITALQNVLFERGLITSPSRGIFGAQTKNALIKEFDLPQNHTFGNELAAEHLEKFNPKTIEAIQEKVDLALSKVQKNLTTLENKMIEINKAITALEAKRVALNDPTIENYLEAQHAAKVAEVESPDLAQLQDDLVLKEMFIAELEQRIANLTALTAQVSDQNLENLEKPDLKIDLLEVENKDILLTMTEKGMSFNINGKDHDASYFNQLQVGITDTQSTYRNENNTLLAKYEYESDQFSIFHKNPYTADKIAVISDFSQQNTINLVSFDAVKTQSLEKQKSLGKEC